jgi:isoleucyl-tRNA synthetase
MPIRYWGTPIPLWVSDDYEEVVCVTSIEELQRLSGRTDITDLHRDNIDDITIPSQRGNGPLTRVKQVFDCWFESGSMPYVSFLACSPHLPSTADPSNPAEWSVRVSRCSLVFGGCVQVFAGIWR